jgi:hypothetical protein
MSKAIKELKAKVKATKAEVRINQKVYNMAERALLRSVRQLDQLEKKLADKLAQTT